MFKKIVLILIAWLLIIATVEAADDNTGIGLLYSNKNITTFTVQFSNGFNFGFFMDPASGEERKANTSNYGGVKIGEDTSVYGLDVGYSKKVYKHLRIGAEASAGYRTEYSKYSDRRFTEGYYLSEEDDEFLLGVGAIAAIPFTDNFEIISSYNSIKGISGGIIIRF